MTISLNSMGPNSAALLWDNETLPNLMTVINDWVVQHGWDLFDNVSTTIKVYRSLNVGGSTYKYLRLETVAGYLDVKHYESWNATTHVGTNLAAAASSSCQLNLVSGTIYLFASNRWFFATGKYGTSFDYGTGIFEFARENPTDTEAAGFPASIACTGHGLTFGGIAMTRNRQNLTATSANSDCALVCSLGVFHSVVNRRQANGVSNFYHADSPTFFSQFADAPAAFDFRGRVYGIKMLPIYFGTHLDIISIKVDANGFADANGTPMDHIILAPSAGRIALPL